MKWVLEEKDRRRPWYCGMGNMTPGEIEDYWKSALKSVATLTVLMAVTLALYIGIMFFDSEMWEKDGDKMIGVCVGVIVTHAMYCFCGIDTLRQRRKLVKEEKGVIL